MIKLFSLFLLCFVGSFPRIGSHNLVNGTSGTLSLNISNVAANTGYIRIAVYNTSEQFLDEHLAVVSKSVMVENERQMLVNIPNLVHGTYAIAIFQDLNSNLKLDKNLFGIPQEPYAISNSSGGKWEIPKFNKNKFEFNDQNTVINLPLKKWKER
jgi:uncharacterized protein (DUF2141 family)